MRSFMLLYSFLLLLLITNVTSDSMVAMLFERLSKDAVKLSTNVDTSDTRV